MRDATAEWLCCERMPRRERNVRRAIRTIRQRDGLLQYRQLLHPVARCVYNNDGDELLFRNMRDGNPGRMRLMTGYRLRL